MNGQIKVSKVGQSMSVRYALSRSRLVKKCLGLRIQTASTFFTIRAYASGYFGIFNAHVAALSYYLLTVHWLQGLKEAWTQSTVATLLQARQGRAVIEFPDQLSLNMGKNGQQELPQRIIVWKMDLFRLTM